MLLKGSGTGNSGVCDVCIQASDKIICIGITDAIWQFFCEDDANKSKDTLVWFAGWKHYIPKNMGDLGFLYPDYFSDCSDPLQFLSP